MLQSYDNYFYYVNNLIIFFAFAADLALEMVGHKETWHYHLILMALPGITLLTILYSPLAAFNLRFN